MPETLYYFTLPNGTVCWTNTIQGLRQLQDEFSSVKRTTRRGRTVSVTPPPSQTNGTPPPSAANGAGAGGWNKLMGFLSGPKKENQRKLLGVLHARQPKSVTIDELKKALGSESGNGIGGILSGLSKNCARAGLPNASVYIKDARDIVRAGPLLIEHGPPAKV